MPRDIILIGPQRAGKSTVAEALARRLGVPRVSMDEVRLGYYEEVGYDATFADDLRRREGFAALYFYWKEFECHAVERLLSDPPDGVIDFGAGHSVYESRTQFGRVAAALTPYPNVVLLLPSRDAAEAVRILWSAWPCARA